MQPPDLLTDAEQRELAKLIEVQIDQMIEDEHAEFDQEAYDLLRQDL